MELVRCHGSQGLLFVGNSHTYQPKELGGVPGALARLAAAASAGTQLLVDSVTQGGADLVDLWEEFETFVRKDGVPCRWDTFVLQVGRGADANAQFATEQVLQHRYAPLILALAPGARVLLYQTWSGPRPEANEARLLSESLALYSKALHSAGVQNVLEARVGHAFLALQTDMTIDKHIYPALWKDDMGHGSALAGALVATVMLISLGLEGQASARLGQILEAMLPGAWRTASAGFAGTEGFGQKGWRDESKGAPAELMTLVGDPEEDLPLSKYPPGMRTERRDLGLAFGDALVAAAKAATAIAEPQSSTGGYSPQPAPTKDQAQKSRRWQKR